MEFRIAKQQETDRCWEIIKEARACLKSLGVNQWQQEYPGREDVAKDINEGNGYVLVTENAVMAYACISFGGEPSYDSIRGAWKSVQPYGVIHRLAVDNTCKGRGFASEFFRFAQELCLSRGIHSIKIDTDRSNEIMKHLLKKNGFEYCGTVYFANSEKIGYEKLI